MPPFFPSIGQTADAIRANHDVPNAPGNPLVAALQEKLEALGYGPVPANERGVYTENGPAPATKAIVLQFQKDRRLPETGLLTAVTVDTINALQPAPAAPTGPAATGLPALLAVALAAASRTARGGEAVPILQQESANVARGLAANPAALRAAATLLQSADAGARVWAGPLFAAAADLQANPTGAGTFRGAAPAGGAPDTTATGAPARGVLAKIGIGLLLTAPAWGAVLWTRARA